MKRYAGFLEAVARQDTGAAFQNRRSLKQHLSEIDHEYLVWVEWKEGFARFIENEIRSRYGIEANEGGKDAPYNRVTFYFGGERFITIPDPRGSHRVGGCRGTVREDVDLSHTSFNPRKSVSLGERMAGGFR